jgi:hypothetical protein
MIDETTSEESLPTITSVPKTFRTASTDVKNIRILIFGILDCQNWDIIKWHYIPGHRNLNINIV